MSSIQAPAWAFTAEAIDGVGDTHLPDGVHVRALPSPQLGLPATPLAVYRSVLSPDHVRQQSLSGGVIWIDSQGHTLSEPFQVTPDNPVYGYFPLPEVIWAALNATPATLPATRPHGVPTSEITPAAGRLTPRLTAPLNGTTSPVPPNLTSSTRPTASLVLPSQSAPLRFDAVTHTAQGPAAFQSRRQAPYTLAAWTIPMMRVMGQGTVHGIRWLPAARIKEQLQKDALWEIWSLPIDNPAPRYVPTPNAPLEAKQRVDRAAVRKQPLYVAYNTPSPAAAPPATGADALGRIAQVEGELQRSLDILLRDLSTPTWALQDQLALSGQAQSHAAIPIEPRLLAGAVDPDVGHHLGLGDVDLKADAPEGSLVCYRIRGLWRWHPKRWNTLQLPSFEPAIRKGRDEAVQSFEVLKKFDIVPREEGPFVDLHTMAVALIGTPPAVPHSVAITATEDRGWLLAPPPHVRRALRILANGFVPRAVAALAATDSNGLRTLHSFPKAGNTTQGKPTPQGTPLPLVVSRPLDAIWPGEGRFEDLNAPASAVDYQLAQGDWFGRWSDWTHRVAPDKADTAPMKPTVELYPPPPTHPKPLP